MRTAEQKESRKEGIRSRSKGTEIALSLMCLGESEEAKVAGKKGI